jgi:hypothetical protein
MSRPDYIASVRVHGDEDLRLRATAAPNSVDFRRP